MPLNCWGRQAGKRPINFSLSPTASFKRVSSCTQRQAKAHRTCWNTEMRVVGIPVGSPMPRAGRQPTTRNVALSIARSSELRSPERAAVATSLVRGRLPQSFHSPQSKEPTRFTLFTLLVLTRRLFSNAHAIRFLLPGPSRPAFVAIKFC
jgi:hypothetical protein